MVHNIFTTCLMLIAFATSCDYVFAQDADKGESPEVEMLTLKLRVLDPDDHPVEGATVTPRGLRTKIERASWYGWNGKRHGEIPELLTDETGIAEVPFPKYVFEKAETGSVNLNVTHPDFVMFDEDRFVEAGEATVKLKRGFRIAVTAIDAETGDRIKKDLYAVASIQQASGKWQLAKSGMLVSPTLAKKPCVLRLVHFADGQPTQFSKRIKIEPDERSRVLKRDIELSPGVRLEGKLDDAIPRPIVNGHVSASCYHDADPKGQGWNRWSWNDRAEIKQDGSFVFESLPDDEVMQLIPVCDGWVPDKANREDVVKYFPEEVRQLTNDWAALPQLTKTDADQLDLMLPMLPAREIKVTVLDPEGKPLPNAAVGCCPNQYYFDGGSTILGTAYRTRDYLIDPKTLEGRYKDSPYGTTTDSTGTAFIKNLPDTGLARSLSVRHADFELPIKGRSRKATFEFAENGVTEVTVKLQKKGTEVLDGSQAEQEQNDLNTVRTVAMWIENVIEGWFQ